MLQGSVGIREKTVWSLGSQQNPPTSSNRRFVASAIPRSQLHDMFFVCDALKWPTKCLHSDNQLPGILIESCLEVRSLHSVNNISRHFHLKEYTNTHTWTNIHGSHAVALTYFPLYLVVYEYIGIFTMVP